MESQVKIALVGISGYGDSYLRALLPGTPAAQLVAVADPAAQNCARLGEIEQRRIPIFTSLEELCRQITPELVLLATPIHLHASQVCFCLEKSINVLCEKPLAGSLEEAYRMLDADRASAAFAAIGYQWSFSQAVQALKTDIMQGRFGRPIRLRTRVSFPRGLDYFARNRWAGRIRTDEGIQVLDSPVNNATAHYLHNMLYLLGPTRETSLIPRTLEAELYRANAIENYDTAALRCRTGEGAEILFYTTHTIPERTGPQSIFEFEKATITYDAGKNAPFVAQFPSGEVCCYGDPNSEPHEKIWQCIAAVRSGQMPVCGIETAIPHTLCVEAAQRSMPKITSFPENLCKLTTIDEQTMIVVQGLSEALLDCFETGALPSERQYEWAKRGEVVTTENLLRKDVARPVLR